MAAGERTSHGELEGAQDAGDAGSFLAHAQPRHLKHLGGVVQHGGLPGHLLEEHQGQAHRQLAQEAPLEDEQQPCKRNPR